VDHYYNTKQLDFCFLQLASSIIKTNSIALYLHVLGAEDFLLDCYVSGSEPRVEEKYLRVRNR
jgi:hypothetical protein